MQTKDLQKKSALRFALMALMIGVAGLANSYAEHVEPEKAKKVVATFLSNNGAKSDQLADLSTKAGFPNLYIFNAEQGFVVMAADDRVKPILGYSLTGKFVAENMPENLKWWLQGYNDQIQYAIDNQLRASTEVAQEWEDLAQGRPNVAKTTIIGEPLIESTWNQYPVYNDLCPQLTPTGCVATAMAQIMRYKNKPDNGIGIHSYIPWSHPEYGVQTANFGATTYNWANMPLHEANSEIAKLMYHCGVSVDMDYDIIANGGSGAYVRDVPNALYEFFGYQRATFKKKSSYSGSWTQMLKDELDDERPVLYSGDSIVTHNDKPNDTISHAFICDGYDDQDRFHFNWGWGGDDDGFYFLNALNPPINGNHFNDNQTAVIGIQPIMNFDCDAPTNLTATLNGRTATLSWTTAEGVDSYRVYYEGQLIDATVTGTTFTDYASLEIGQHHYYVRSNCADGSVSGSSNIVEIEVVFQGNEIATIGNLRYSLNEQDLTAEVIGHKNSNPTGTLTIPSSVTYTNQYGQTHTYSVVSIRYGAFMNCSGFTGSLTIPNSVTMIGEQAFSNCSGFTGSLNIGNSVTSIGYHAFYGCSGFTGSLTIPNSVTSIGNSAFSGCSFNGLNIDMINIPSSFVWNVGGSYSGSLTIGSSVTLISSDAFRNCSGFTGSLTIGNSVTTIGYSAFEGCNGFTGSLTIGNSVTTIREDAFRNCSGFTGSLTIPNSVTIIEEDAFRNCNGFTGSLTIGNSVTSIGEYAFYDCSGFTGSLTIPNSVTMIEEETFRNCSGFTGSLTIGNSVTSIGYRAFYGCSGFTGSMTIGNSVISIGEYAFYDCSGFTGSLTIPNSVISIGEHAFWGCSGFAGSLTISNAVTTIGNGTFCNCSGFTGSLTIPNSVTSIGEYAFAYSGFTGSLTIPNSVISIGEDAFYGCSGFTGSLTIPNSVTSIGNGAFYNCSFNGLNIDMINIPSSFVWNVGGSYSGSLTIGSSVTLIGNRAFAGCSGFTGSLNIPNSVTSIGYRAFYGCSGFTGSLTIPNSMTSIDNSAFYGCSGFTGSLTIPNSVTSIGEDAFAFSGFTGSLTIPNSVISIGKGAFAFSGFTGSLTIGNSVMSIGYHAFQGCSGFTGSLTIPNSVTSIGYEAFYDCSFNGLNIDMANIPNDFVSYFGGIYSGTLTIGNSVTSIGNSAFYGCSGFTGSLNIPNSVTSIGNSAFYGCSGFTGFLTIGNSVTSIGGWAFRGCSGFTGSLTIPNSVISIGNEAFDGCSGFTGSLTIGDFVTSIGNSAFYGCSGFIGLLNIPNSVTSIGDWAFIGCNGFTGALTIPNSVTSIGNGAFAGCIGFTGSLTIGNSVTSIGNWAFEGCSGFTGSLTIPNSVISIGGAAFYGCSGFNGLLTIHNSVTSIDYSAFYNCSGFTGTLTIPDSVTSIGNYTFYNCSGFTGSLTIPNSVTSIGNSAFSGCSGFSSDLSIPNSVTSIGESAFASCSGFSSIHSYGAVPPATDNNAFGGMNYSIPVYVPLCSATDYAEASQWSNFTDYQAVLPCPYTFTGNGTDNLWSNPDNWHTLPANDYDIIINANCEMDEDVEASGVIINNTGTLVIKSGHVLTINGNNNRSGEVLVGEIVNHGTAANLIIEDGGQLVYDKSGLQGTVQKAISPYTQNGNDGWHLLAYPLTGNGTVAEQENMLINDYDLYYYDEPTHYWMNYKDTVNDFNQLEAGEGYLYANSGKSTPVGAKVGEGTSTTSYFPFYTFYNYSLSENLFLATELSEAGLGAEPLGSLCWNATRAPGYEQSNISIWMANVEDEALASTSHLTSEMTLVYTGSMTPALGWNVFVFNENSFAWDGTSNLLISVQRNNGDWNTSVSWQCHYTSFTAQAYAYTDDAEYDATTTTYSMSTSLSRPNIIFKTVEEIGAVEQTSTKLSFAGELENGSATINIPLSYTESAGQLKGFNLVGNPFVHNVTTYGSTNVAEGCYQLNEAKDDLIVSEIDEENPLKPAEGFFVKATDEGASITFNPGRGEAASRSGSIRVELSDNGKLIDRLIVKMEGEPLQKLSLKEQRTKLFATQDHQEIAIVPCVGNEQPVNFKAAKNGEYTINVNTNGLEFNYLHLIDNLTGADVDLVPLLRGQGGLNEPRQATYTFEAKTTDYASRFRLVFSVCGDADGDDAPFAFISNGNIIITAETGDASLQVIDMLGRVLVCRDARRASAISITGMAKGVYVLRLIEGEKVRTQKIVID